MANGSCIILSSVVAFTMLPGWNGSPGLSEMQKVRFSINLALIELWVITNLHIAFSKRRQDSKQ
jgi:hypothetical protein